MSRDLVAKSIAEWHAEFPEANLIGLELSGRIHQLQRRIAAIGSEVLSPLGLEAWEWDVLSALWRAREVDTTMSDLSARFLITAGTVTNRVSRLERRGFVLRATDPLSRRRVLVTLTAAGEEQVRIALPIVFAASEECARLIRSVDIRAVNDVLSAVMADLQEPAR